MTEPPKLEDLDPVETREWLESIDSVLKTHGPERAHFLLERLIDYTRRSGAYLPFKPNTAYVNTIAAGREPEYPGNRALERRIEAYIRWNALAMVLAANKASTEYGGHLASYASSATLYEVGFNHFWRAPSAPHPGDMVFMQGHSSPGIYARAYLEGRLSEQQLQRFRQEASAPGVGLSSYPHPWLMPDFWQFPTVSMGLGPMMAIFQARFTRYLEHRGLVKPSDRKVWAFLGDGEMDEPESMGALTMPVREGLDNLIFVINCNLQRLDGPVRGNGKIIQELEAAFLGAGWNVIKVLWGSRWDPLLARDHKGLLRRVMEECVDGEYQNFKAKGGAYTREHFFGKYPELKAMVANMSDEEIWRLNRGGHDPRKVYAAYAAAMSHKGQPTVILAKTVKGFGLGKGGEGQMVAHQQKKLSEEDLREFRDRFNIPVTDEDIARLPFRKPDESSEEMRYLKGKRARARRLPAEPPPHGAAAGGAAAGGLRLDPGGHRRARDLHHDGVRAHAHGAAQGQEHRQEHRADRAGRGAHLRHGGPVPPDRHLFLGRPAVHAAGCRDPDVLPRGQEGPDARGGHQRGRLAVLVDRRRHRLQQSRHQHGAVLHLLLDVRLPARRRFHLGGRRHAGARLPAGRHRRAHHARRRGPAAPGRPQPAASPPRCPNCVAYDPAYAYELAVIIHDGMRRMFAEQESVFYYITVMNENYAQPAMPAGRGARHPARRLPAADRRPRQGARDAARLRHDPARVRWRRRRSSRTTSRCPPTCSPSPASASCAARRSSASAGTCCTRARAPRVPYVRELLSERAGPVVAATDYMRTVPDQIRQWVERALRALGTDGFGRSDSRAALRRHFEVDRNYIAVAALKALADDGQVDQATVSEAIKALGIDPAKPVPWKV